MQTDIFTMMTFVDAGVEVGVLIQGYPAVPQGPSQSSHLHTVP